MADVLAVMRQQYVQRQLLARRAVLATRKAWRQVDPSAIRATWHAAVGPAVLSLTTSAQLEAASTANSNASAILAAEGVTAPPVAMVDAAAFAGIASDGRDLASLLELSNLYALRAIGLGQTPKQALAVGGQWLERVVGNQVLDAARSSSSVAIAVRPQVTGYVRMLNLPSCERCVVLAGRFYRWNAGFLRHPNCDCVHVPATEDVAGDIRTDPRKAIESGQVRGLSKADYKAIVEDGADPAQVINAHRGMSTEQAFGRRLKVTREGMTRRGRAGKSLGTSSAGIRLRPESIYQVAKDRDDAIRLLRRYGYITDELPQTHREGFGQYGKGGKAKAAREAVLEARRTGVRDKSNPYTMTAAELRQYKAEMRDLFARAQIGSPPAFFARMTLAEQREWLIARAAALGS